MKPILFNTDMVRAILEGRKTVTRRAVKGYALEHLEIDTDGSIIGVYDQYEGNVRPVMDFATYHPGDILYVRETWAWRVHGYLYRAWPGVGQEPERQDKAMQRLGMKWHPSIHMPKEAARLFLRVTAVRVERLQEITLEEVEKEGIDPKSAMFNEYADLWDTTIKPADLPLYGWDANPWVWVIEFERVSKEAALEGGNDHA